MSRRKEKREEPVLLTAVPDLPRKCVGEARKHTHHSPVQ